MRYTTRRELLDKILEAGTKFDGHVTHGSASELANLIEDLLRDDKEVS